MEQWRDVPGYEGLYQISIDTEECRCKSLSYRHSAKPKELKNRKVLRGKQFRGYWQLCKNGVCITRQIAKWVALTFPELVENEYFEGAHIDHKDTNTLNNHPSNLRWVTAKENSNNPLTLLHMKTKHKKHKRKRAAVSSQQPVTGHSEIPKTNGGD